MSSDTITTRRAFMAVAGTFGAGLIVLGPARIVTAAGKEAKKEEEISPVEDLMREHGVLRRVLLIYEESLRRIDTGRELPREVIPGAAGIIRRQVRDVCVLRSAGVGGGGSVAE